MKRIFLLVMFFLLSYTAQAQNREAIQGYCERGGEAVVTDGRASTTKVQRTFSSCTVRVFVAGTTTPASIYSDNSGTAKSNPFVADTDGYWKFYVPAGRYDVRMEGAGIPTPFTRSGYWVSTGGASSIPSCTAGQMLYYATTGSVPTCLGLGNTMSITNGLLNSTASGGGGSGTILPNSNSINYLSVYQGQGTTVGPSSLRYTKGNAFDLFSVDDSATLTYMTGSNLGAVTQPGFSLGKSFTFGGSTTESAYISQIVSDFSAGTYTGGNANVYSAVTPYTGSSIGTTSGFLSNFQAVGGQGSIWSGFRSRLTQDSAISPSAFYSFYSEPPTITSGSVTSFTGFYAPAPAALTGITTYRAFHSTGGTSTFRRSFSSDGVELANGMPLRMFGPEGTYGGISASWGFAPTQSTPSYTYLLPDTTPEMHKHLTVTDVTGTSVRLGWEMGTPNCTNDQILYYSTGMSGMNMSCLSLGTNLSITNGELNAAAGGGGGGTVTSVGLTVPTSTFETVGNAVTTSGSLQFAFKTQNQNLVLASPSSANGVPSFRALTSADLPSLTSIYQPTNANLTTISNLAASSGNSLYYNGSTWTAKTLDKTDVGLNNVENTAISTWSGSSNITSVGTIATGTWNGNSISPAKGGAAGLTGLLKANSGVVSVASSTTDYAPAIPAGTNQLLVNNGSNGFSTLNIGNSLSTSGGTLEVVTGGSGSVMSVAVVPSNGITATVTNPNTTPSIALGLGDITPTKVNDFTFTKYNSGVGNSNQYFRISGGTVGGDKFLEVYKSIQLSASADGYALNIGSGGTLTSTAFAVEANFVKSGDAVTRLKGGGSGSPVRIPFHPGGDSFLTYATIGSGLEIVSNVLQNSLATTPQGQVVYAGPDSSNGLPGWRQVNTGHIANLAITSAKLATDSVTNSNIAAGAVTTAKIGDLQVTNAKIADSTITVAKISATGTPSASTYLNGAGQWTTPASGGGGTYNTNLYIPYSNAGTSWADSILTANATSVTANCSGNGCFTLRNSGAESLVFTNTTSSGSSTIRFNRIASSVTNEVGSLVISEAISGQNSSNLIWNTPNSVNSASVKTWSVETQAIGNVLNRIGSGSNDTSSVYIYGSTSTVNPSISLNTYTNAAHVMSLPDGRPATGSTGLKLPWNVTTSPSTSLATPGIWYISNDNFSTRWAGMWFDITTGTNASGNGFNFQGYGDTSGSAARFNIRTPNATNAGTIAFRVIPNATGSAMIDLGATGSDAYKPLLRFFGTGTNLTNQTNYIALSGPDSSYAGGILTWRLPLTQPSSSNNDVLQSDQNGNWSWTTSSGTGSVVRTLAPTFGSVVYDNLSQSPYATANAGTVVYCSNCSAFNGTCQTNQGSAGTFAVKNSSGWRCM